MRNMRLDKLIARTGLSRRDADRMIRSGKVQIDGVITTDPGKCVNLDIAHVSLNGASVRTDAHFYIMMNKPAGCITATEDQRSRTVIDLLPYPWRHLGLGPVGRLDKDVTGLVILTTDGILAHRLISPHWEQEKRYIVWAEGCVNEDDIAKVADGLPLKDFTCREARLSVLRYEVEKSLCEITISEGKFHQVKRMFSYLGHPVLELRRASIAGIDLDQSLDPGQWRELTKEEVMHLYAAVDLEVP